MTATASSVNPSFSSAQEFRVSNNQTVRGETRMARVQHEISWQSNPLVVGTNALVRPDSPAVSVRRAQPIAEAPQVQNDRRDYVDGVISEAIGDGLVKCVVKVGGRDLVITLPMDCFEMQIVFGRPFRLTMEQKGGFRVPRVVPIAPEPLGAEDEALLKSVLGDAQG